MSSEFYVILAVIIVAAVLFAALVVAVFVEVRKRRPKSDEPGQS